MPQEQIDFGQMFAYAFYCPRLHTNQPSSTYAFSELRKFRKARIFMGVSRIANILWQSDNPEDARKIVQDQFDGAEYRGIFTTKNYLLIGEGQFMQALPVVGPRVSLKDFVNGPIARVEEPSDLEVRGNVVRLGMRPQAPGSGP